MKKNETVAIALKYPKTADVPFISAKAKGKLAEQLLQIAEKEKIPIVKDVTASNVLSVQDVGSAIPENMWEIVAKIFACVVECNEKL